MSARLRAFTLVEVLTAIAILAILTSVAVGGGAWAFRRAYTARAQAELSALATALEAYKRQHGDYPRTSGGESRGAQLLQALVGAREPSGAVLNPRGRLWIELGLFTTREGLDPLANAAADLIDPWGNAYVYIYKEPLGGWVNPGFVLYSAGPDGRHNPALLLGGYSQRDLDENRDNLYAAP